MAVDPNQTNRYRYPGTKYFEANQSDIFFGRKEETNSLIHSIKAHDIFVIFADSGIGKTSLLNAGIIPEFENENDLEKIMPIKFRFQDTTRSPLAIIARKLSEYTDKADLAVVDENYSLWQHVKRCHFKEDSDTKEKIPLLIFDQFEEFFNYRRAEREACINQLSDLTNQYLPDYIRDQMEEKFLHRKPDAEEIRYYTPPRVKLLFLIRADKLKLLDDLSKKIPVILRNRFHLKPLNIKQAKEAIIFPACLPRNGFVSPAFGFQDEAVQQICAYLQNSEEEVESFQLQILCQELEKRIMERYASGNSPELALITEDELGGEAGMNDITKNYYVNKINAIQNESMRKKAVELIEDKLIVEDRRISQAEFLLLKEGYSRELLDYLLGKTRLIRIDNDAYIEISHDRLLPSILNLKRKRKEEEEKAEAIEKVKAADEEQKRALQQEQEENIKKIQLDYLKDKVKKAARLRVLIVILAVLLVGLLWTNINAEKAKTRANISLANFYIEKQDFDSAASAIAHRSIFSVFDISSISALKEVRERIQIWTVKKDSSTQYIARAASVANAAMAIASNNDSQFSNPTKFVRLTADTAKDKLNFIDSCGGKLLLAWHLNDTARSTGLNLAVKLDAHENEVTTTIESTTSKLIAQAINSIEIFQNADKKEMAKIAYLKAKRFVDAGTAAYMSFDKHDTLDLTKCYKQLYNGKSSLQNY